MFPTRLVQKPSSVPTLLPAHPSFGYQDNLAVQCVYSVSYPLYFFVNSLCFVWVWTNQHHQSRGEVAYEWPVMDRHHLSGTICDKPI
jgi:hypothetical protein